MAKKLAEEAVEVVIDAMHGDRDAVVKESADLIYNLVVLWVSSGIRPEDVWKEMDRRERLLGIAEKVPKKVADNTRAPHRCVALETRRVCASAADLWRSLRATRRPMDSCTPASSAKQTGHAPPPLDWCVDAAASRKPYAAWGSWARCRSRKARSFRCRPTSC